MDSALQMLGLAKKAGRLEIGEEPVGAVARARKAKLLILASDAAANTARRAAHFGEAGNVLFLTTPFTKAELGMTVGRSSCAMLAFTDPGFAASFVEKLAARDPERYGPAAEQIRAKADKALQRQKEQRQHEKNLERGKKKPWAAPSKKKEPAQLNSRTPQPGKKAPQSRGAQKKTAPTGKQADPGARPARPKRRSSNS